MKQSKEPIALPIVLIVLIGTIAFLSGMLWAIHTNADVIPKSTEGITFTLINVEHCAKTYNQICWINNNEKDKIQDWKAMANLQDKQLVLR